MKKAHLRNDRILFIGLGGAGGRTISQLKKELYREFIEEEIKERYRFLMIDTDLSGLRGIVEHGELEEDEILPLTSNRSVGGCMNPLYPEWKLVSGWANSNLYINTSGNAQFSGYGSGMLRQVGRAHFLYPENHTKVHDTLVGMINQIRKDTLGFGLKVYIFTGITGGTGSGILLDLGIMIKDILRDDFPSMNCYGVHSFLFTPSNDSANSVLNAQEYKNAYATLKELDYIDSVLKTGKMYCFKYGKDDSKIISGRLFDSMTLLEGGIDGVHFTDAINTIIKTMVNVLCVDYANSFRDGSITQMIDGVLTNDTALNLNLGDDGKNVNHAYNTIGYTECTVPVEAILSSITEAMLEMLHGEMVSGSDFTLASESRKIIAADHFFAKCELDNQSIRKGVVKKEIVKRINAEIHRMIHQDGEGPYYVIALLSYLTEPNGYLFSIIRDYQKKSRGLFSKKYECYRRIYRWIHGYLSSLQQKLYDLYTIMPDVLRERIVLDSEFNKDEYNTAMINWKSVSDFTSSYNWESLSCKAVDYIEKKYFGKTIGRFVNELIEELWNKRRIAEGTEENRIKAQVNDLVIDFLDDNIYVCVSKESERLLTLSYTNDESHLADDLCLKLRSEMQPAIKYNHMFIEDCLPVACFLIPSEWDYISSSLCVENNPYTMQDVHVFHTPFSNRISGFTLHHGVSLNMLSSVTDRMKSCYDDDPHQAGLHLVQTAEEDWADLPDLLDFQTAIEKE